MESLDNTESISTESISTESVSTESVSTEISVDSGQKNLNDIYNEIHMIRFDIFIFIIVVSSYFIARLFHRVFNRVKGD